jgi:chromosome segregation ATPase
MNGPHWTKEEIKDLNDKIKDLNDKIKKLEQDNTQLMNELEFLHSDATIESMRRDALNTKILNLEDELRDRGSILEFFPRR